MRVTRYLGAAAVAVLAGTIVGPPVTAQTTTAQGVGTSEARLELLGADVGDLLQLQLLSDTATATTENTAFALARLVPLNLSSSLLPDLSRSLPALESRTPNGEPSVSVEAQDVDAAPLFGGTVTPSDLSTQLGDDGARASVDTSVVDLSTVAGLLSVDDISSLLGANALLSQADVLRGLNLENLNVLDLGTLLNGLGLELVDLPLNIVLDLVDSLGLVEAGTLDGLLAGLGLENITNGDALAAATATLQSTFATVTGLLQNVCNGLGGTAILPPLGDLLNCDNVVATVTQLTNQLIALVDGLLGILDDISLLSLSDLTASLSTVAGTSVDNSSASVDAGVGDISVGGINLGGIDLLGTLEQVTAVVDQVLATVNAVLGAVAPPLGDLIDLKLLDRGDTGVTSTNGVVQAVAQLTAIEVNIRPLTSLDLGAISDILDGLGVGDLLDSLTGGVGGQSANAPVAFGQVPGLDLGFLTEGLSVRALTAGQVSSFTPAPATPETPAAPAAPSGPLARTGSSTPWLILGAGLGLAALVTHRATRVRTS